MASQKNVREIAPVNVVRFVEQEPYKVGDRAYILGGKDRDPVAGNVVAIGEYLGVEFLHDGRKEIAKLNSIPEDGMHYSGNKGRWVEAR